MAEETRAAIRQLEEAVAQQPANMPWIYILATYYDRARDANGVVRWLTRLDELGWQHGVAPDAFRNTNTSAFRNIVARLEAREPRVNRATAAFTLSGQRTLIPEGIAWDPVDDVFYLSSLRRKVLRVDRFGRAPDFIAEGRDGLLATLGMKVDAQRRLLWVASGATPEMQGFGPEVNGRSMLLAYDLRDGRLVRKIASGSAEQPSLLNDLALLDDGSVLVTDTTRQAVLRLAPGAETLEVWAEELRYPNGIALSEDQRFVYVADFRGITRIALADKSRQKIETNALLNGIDGLSFDRNTLIGIQNAIGKPRVLRIHLDDNNRVEILESKNALFEIPTTGVVVGREYYFIANPGLRSFDEKGEMWPVERLEEPVMMRIGL